MQAKQLASAALCILFVGCTATTTIQENESQSSDSTSSSSTLGSSSASMNHGKRSLSSGEIDSEASSITFIGGSSIIDHDGAFTNFDVSLVLDTEEPENFEKAQLAVSIDITSVKTDSEKLDAHLMAAEFFDTETYPTATFTSTGISQSEDGTYAIAGVLQIKATTKKVTLPAVLTAESLTISYNLPRKEYNIGNDAYGQKLLEDQVPVRIKLLFGKTDTMEENMMEEMMDEDNE
jgi:polyisoprenoid-binding protein YceI